MCHDSIAGPSDCETHPLCRPLPIMLGRPCAIACSVVSQCAIVRESPTNIRVRPRMAWHIAVGENCGKEQVGVLHEKKRSARLNAGPQFSYTGVTSCPLRISAGITGSYRRSCSSFHSPSSNQQRSVSVNWSCALLDKRRSPSRTQPAQAFIGWPGHEVCVLGSLCIGPKIR